MSLNLQVVTMVGFGVAIASCGGPGSDGLEVDSGRFTATVSGAFSGSLSGDAIAFSSGPVFEIHLDDIRFPASITIARPAGGRPSPGTYAFAPDPEGDPFSLAFLIPTQDLQDLFFSRSGSLTITVASDDRMKGSFNFVARAPEFMDPPRTVTGQGTFDALQGAFDAFFGISTTSTGNRR